MSAEKSAARSGAAATASRATRNESAKAPKDDSECLEMEQPKKPPRHKSKVNQPVETTIDNLDDGVDDVSFRAVLWMATNTLVRHSSDLVTVSILH